MRVSMLSGLIMIGGIVVATVLLFLPALYVAWYRINEPV
jgi:hypothetical protein